MWASADIILPKLFLLKNLPPKLKFVRILEFRTPKKNLKLSKINPWPPNFLPHHFAAEPRNGFELSLK
ncbi:hypothetical protein A2924_00495 [Candidatus Giovannonibacteria bacterium RIFCSPLOWO2_01_FULL_44_16]|uniref:Uncharacterized protein n=1 Tax=Candidatus Giovannonibacteria bacterium RIFCSPLOWO2_01_FULL_44_16 TaxID=1798348 RepID=A0A1F5X2N8_9BACT|nr:MAG: hypothetical protein A2924_00495 [Candidatus Giovannonibacteria bacterium RIFCSPLOWO2_01_FULL_44_16]